jgi:hypothetical protein
METSEVTFDETQPCNSSIFECAGDDEVVKKIFKDEENDAGEDDGYDGEAPVTHVHSTSTMTSTVQDGSSPTPTTVQQDHVEAAVEGEVVSRLEAPRHIQVDHPPSKSSATSMSVRHDRGPKMLLTLLIQLLLPPLSRKTLNTRYLILIVELHAKGVKEF